MRSVASRPPRVRPKDQVDLFGADLPVPAPVPRKKRAAPAESAVPQVPVAKPAATRPRRAESSVDGRGASEAQAVSAPVTTGPAAPAAAAPAAARVTRKAEPLAVQFGAVAAHVVRDTFSMPKGDHAMIQQLRLRAAKAGHPVSKSEVVRAALVALSSASSERIVALLAGLEKVKPGRKG